MKQPSLLFILPIFSLLTSCKAPLPKPYSFFVAGHVYGSSYRKAPGLHPPFVAEFDSIRQYPNMRFGIFTGDIVYYSRDEYWDVVDREVEQLGINVYFTTGNHDEGHKSPYKDRYGLTYYQFEQEGDLCIVLNPGLGGWNIWKEQMAFLKEVLAEASRYHNIFIFFHQLLWVEPDNAYSYIHYNSRDGRTPHINFWPEVFPLLQATQRPVYLFAGDVGAHLDRTHYSADTLHNVHMYSSGMGTNYHDNYLIVEVNKQKQVDVLIRIMKHGQLMPLNSRRKKQR